MMDLHYFREDESYGYLSAFYWTALSDRLFQGSCGSMLSSMTMTEEQESRKYDYQEMVISLPKILSIDFQ